MLAAALYARGCARLLTWAALAVKARAAGFGATARRRAAACALGLRAGCRKRNGLPQRAPTAAGDGGALAFAPMRKASGACAHAQGFWRLRPCARFLAFVPMRKVSGACAHALGFWRLRRMREVLAHAPHALPGLGHPLYLSSLRHGPRVFARGLFLCPQTFSRFLSRALRGFNLPLQPISPPPYAVFTLLLYHLPVQGDNTRKRRQHEKERYR